ncbi:MAG: metallophosphoesterase [Woeseiaceae bacterium]
MRYDLIGDIHGYSEPLVRLLKKLGYLESNGVYRNSERQAIFLGDFIDRGPNQRDVIKIVRPMIEEGAALSVMGNHEFNAIGYFTEDPDDPGEYLREHSKRHRRQHQVFLDAYQGSDDYAELIEWFRTLPLWLELPGLRVVHACWDDALMQDLKVCFPSINQYLDDNLLLRAWRKGRSEHDAIETLLKGKEIELPKGHTFFDKDGHARHEVRIRWFDGDALTYHDAFLGPEKAKSHIPEDPIGADHLLQYSHDDPPVFIGHYWLDTEPTLLAPNIACLDYSVAAEGGGKLVAYRWDGEQALSNDKFVYVERDPS